jgi:hypothetical protein
MAEPRTRGPGHEEWCEADTGKTIDHDCAITTRLARLTALAEAVRDEFKCPSKPSEGGAVLCGDVDDCWACFARQALEQVPG